MLKLYCFNQRLRQIQVGLRTDFVENVARG